MNELGIKLCDIQGRLFELSVRKGLDSAAFIDCFMRSKVAACLDSTYNRMQWAGEEYLLEELMSECADRLMSSENVFDKDEMYWIGYLYRYWSISQNERSAEIYRQARTQVMRRNYLMFHTLDPELAVENLKEIHRQRKRHTVRRIPGLSSRATK